jgi:hypothetical protein
MREECDMSLRQVEPNELAVTFGVDIRAGEVDIDMVRLDDVSGLQPPDLRDIEEDLGVTASVQPGGVGVGASGPGIELILAYASIPGDLLALVQVGGGVLKVIQRVRKRRERTVVVSHGPTLGALAAASIPTDAVAAMTGMEYAGCRNLNGDEPPNWLGTDDRHIWAVVFEHPTNGAMGIVFMAPSGIMLGWTVVPHVAFFNGSDYLSRSPEQIVAWRTRESLSPGSTRRTGLSPIEPEIPEERRLGLVSPLYDGPVGYDDGSGGRQFNEGHKTALASSKLARSVLD